MSNAAKHFIAEVLRAYPPFRWEPETEELWMSVLMKRLPSFSDEVLTRTLDHMLATRDDRRTPLPPECLKFCQETRRQIDMEKGKSNLPIEPSAAEGDWTADRLRLADSLVMTPLGKEAAKNGWIGMLHSFCRKNMRAPVGPEIEACKREAKEFDKAYAQCVKGGWPGAKGLEKLGASMLKKRQALTDMVLHGVVK